MTSYAYASGGVDVLRVYQRNLAGENTDPDGKNADKIAEYEYNSKHLPITSIDAARQTTIRTYNSRGQVMTIQNPKGEITTYGYGNGSNVPDGYLASITSPPFPSVNGASAVTSFTYDSAHRVRTVTNNPDGYQTTTDYDDLDRPMQILYPDGTTRQFQYEQDFGRGIEPILDLTASKDRLGRWTLRHYNSIKQLDHMIDPLGRPTSYDWCACGSLTSLTDANENITKFERDLQSRVFSKTFAFGAPNSTSISYTYENSTSRLKSTTDALGQTTNYRYFLDDRLKQIFYTNAQNPTPAVNYAYDQYYDRITSITSPDLGPTTYQYHPVTVSPGTHGANQLKSVDGIFSNDTIEYTYDELGRIENQSIDGVSSSMTYDSLGRIETTTNALGSFTRNYDTVTSRLLTLNYPNGQTENHAYFGNDNDHRLQTLLHLTGSSSTLSRFDYTYDAEGQVLTTLAPAVMPTYDYDAANQLVRTTLGSIIGEGSYGFQYDYDLAGNRLRNVYFTPYTQFGSVYTANNLNQIATVSHLDGNSQSEPVPLAYDANGNMTYDGANETYDWDAANRLVAIDYSDTGNRTEFAYDGLGRRVRITEKGPGFTAIVQPASANYDSFKTGAMALPAGDYTLSFEGINPNGGDNTAFVDAVELNSTPVSNGSFESPVIGYPGYQFNPPDSTWSFQGTTGISGNGTAFTSGNPNAPDGVQVSFVQSNGAILQELSLSAGTYALSFQAAQRGNFNASFQQLRASLRQYSVATATRNFVWCGNQICEERDGTGVNVTKRFFAEGEKRIGGDGGNYYYTRDHLGSIREVTDSGGGLVAKYDYDAWGKSVVVSGKMTVDFGYTGHYFHQPSGLNLSLNRAYSPTLGRWISRDPLKNAETSQGANLYAYVANDPLNSADPLGLCPGDWWDPRTWFNEGLADSLADTATSIGDVWGDWWYGNNWNIARDAGYGPLGQVENNPAAYATEWGLIGTSTVATAIAVGADVVGNVRIVGPSTGFLQYGEGRIVGLLYANVPILRLDYAPIPGSGDQPVLHLNVGPSGFHIPLYDSRYPTFPPGP